MVKAFKTWAYHAHFKLVPAQDYSSVDIRFFFAKRDHGDGSPFDGPGGTLVHWSAPTLGVLHFDADEYWAAGKLQGAFDLETAALHESTFLGSCIAQIRTLSCFHNLSPESPKV